MCLSVWSPVCGAPGGGDCNQAKEPAELGSLHRKAQLWRVSSPLDAAASVVDFIPLHGHAQLTCSSRASPVPVYLSPQGGFVQQLELGVSTLGTFTL